MHRRFPSRRAVRRLIPGGGLVVWHLVAAPLAPAQAIPDRLSDSTFWNLITALSEPGGSFISDNFVSNELAFQYVIPQLRSTVKTGGVYLGVGPDQNFTYIVALEPRISFIVDIRRQNMLQHLMYKALIEASADRAEFLSRLFSRVRPSGLDTASTAEDLLAAYARVEGDSLLFRLNLAQVLDRLVREHALPLSGADSTSIEYVYAAFHGLGPDLTYAVGRLYRGFGGGWPTYRTLMTVSDGHGVLRSYLASERNFRLLKDLQERNLIVPVVGDFGGPKSLRMVADWVRSRGGVVTAFYTSNVEQYLFQQGRAWQNFYESVAAMPLDSTSTFIRSVSNRAWVQPQHPASRSASLLAPMQAQLAAFREGLIQSYQDLVWFHAVK